MNKVYDPQNFNPYNDDWPTDPDDVLKRRALVMLGGCGNSTLPDGSERVAFIGGRYIVIAWSSHLAGAPLELEVRDLAEFVKGQIEVIRREGGADNNELLRIVEAI
jgi:hypothetical protein